MDKKMKTMEMFLGKPSKHHKAGMLCSNYAPYIHS